MTAAAAAATAHETTVENGRKSLRRRRRSKPQRLDPETSQIFIIGAGLAGLSAAISLTQAGFRRITVWERDPSLDHQKEGYGLTLTYNPNGPLAALGVLETVAQADCPSRSHYVFRAKDGLPIGYFGNAFFQQRPNGNGDKESMVLPRRGQGQRGNLRIPRKVLRKILYDRLMEERAKLHQRDNIENVVGVDGVIRWSHKLVEFQWKECNQQYMLKFETSEPTENSNPTSQTVSVAADLLVAADGIRSAILQQMYIEQHNSLKNMHGSQSSFPKPPPPTIYESPDYFGLRPLGVRLILGIADFDSNNSIFNEKSHPLQLLNERGFYTLDGQGRRLFTMPYQSNRFAQPHERDRTPNRIMWQLSFAASSTDGDNLLPLDAESLRSYVLEICHSWHAPVVDLIRATPLESIWETDLMDRDTRGVYEGLINGCNMEKRSRQQPRYPRLVVVGDAFHSMSPFKGQGANQALADGPLLAKWLRKSSVDAAVTGWWRETLNRTVPIVQASRIAAQELHADSAIVDWNNTDNPISSPQRFAGIQRDAVPKLMDLLQKEGLGAHLGRNLDGAIHRMIDTNGWFEPASGKPARPSTEQSHWEREALRWATIGDTGSLRRMSLDQERCGSIFTARDTKKRNCLHLAVLNNNAPTTKWLLVELQCCPNERDVDGNTASYYASKHPKLAHIFSVVAMEDRNELRITESIKGRS